MESQTDKAAAWGVFTALRHVKPYLRRYRRQFALGFLCVVATDAIAVFSPWVLKYAIEDLKFGVTSSKLTTYALWIVVLALAAGVFRYLMRRIIISVSRYIEYDLRVAYFTHLQRLSPSFYDHQQTGDLMTRATSDVEAIRMMVGPAIMYSMDTILTAALALSFMLALSAPLTFCVLAVGPLLSGMIYYLAKKIHAYSLASQARFSDLNAMIQEHLSGVRVVKAYCQEEPERRLFQTLNRNYMQASMKLVRMHAALIPFFYSVFGVGMAIVLYVGGRGIVAGRMSLGDFVAFSAYIGMLAWPVMAIGWVLNLFQRGSASLQRVQQILSTESEIADVPTARLIERLNGEIRFQNLDFAYPQASSYALKDITLTIPAGSSLGIVGAVGSGKSSLVGLITRQYSVTAGELLIDGVNVAEIPLDVLRREVAVVPQESLLFSSPLAENLAFVDPEMSEVRIRQVAEIANLMEDVQNFPDGLKTWVGERGITLSGGQKQRACLARALAAEPRILIMDDSFSAVDTQTEAALLRKLRQELQEQTVLIIAHRISTLQWADQIIVLEAGRIIERGTHDELIALQGRYASLYQKQLLEEELRAAV